MLIPIPYHSFFCFLAGYSFEQPLARFAENHCIELTLFQAELTLFQASLTGLVLPVAWLAEDRNPAQNVWTQQGTVTDN